MQLTAKLNINRRLRSFPCVQAWCDYATPAGFEALGPSGLADMDGLGTRAKTNTICLVLLQVPPSHLTSK